jgi:exodeoxyribonuclease VII large subunit
MQPNALSLLELNKSIKEIVKAHTEKKYWIIGEISELKINNSGHCYLELIQKDENTDQIVARSRATIWAANFRMIKPYFETTTGHSLEEGLGILVKVSVDFHEVFGLSLNITDIEPTYTVGELAIQKQKIIDRLTAEGVIGMNRELELPRPCQKIAVISSATAAGYEDFIDQLVHNGDGFKFYFKLFPALMQGEEAEKSIIAALDKIYASELVFDCVVIIRGGGSQADLSCFNNYWLAYHITQFPLPVLTGIGHEQDDSVVDVVAHTRLKTPTAVAAFLIDSMVRLLDELIDIQNQAINLAQNQIASAKNELVLLGNNLRFSVRDAVVEAENILTKHKHTLALQIRRILHRHELNANRIGMAFSYVSKRYLEEHFASLSVRTELIKQSTLHMLTVHDHTLRSASSQLLALDPTSILNRGYSITSRNGAIVKDAGILAEGDVLETRLHKGKVQTIVKKKIL